MPRTRNARVAYRAGLAASLVVGAVASSTVLPAHASGVAVGTAVASGVRTTYDLPGYLILDRPLDDGGPVAQAVLNTSGGATGFASLPYPGDTVVNAPAAVSVGTGQPFPFTYPLYVFADGDLTPRAHAQDPTGTVDLTATADDHKATGVAKGKPPQGGDVVSAGSVQDTSVVTAPDGRMTATADSITRGIDLGVLKIGQVHVRSVTTLKPGDAKPSTVTTTEVTGASVSGQGITITKDGVTLAGQSAGAAYQPILDNVNTVLAQAGISVAIVGDIPVKGGMSSSGLEIVQRHTLPVAGSPTGTSTTVIGNAMTLVVGGTADLPDLPAGPVLPPSTDDGSTSPATAVAPGRTATPALGAPDVPAPSSDSPQVNGAPPALASGQRRETQLLAADLGSQLGFFYMVIALGAGVFLTSATLWRAKGVRAQWIS